MKWKPIETAPKDRKILLWFTLHAGTACVGKWEDQRYHVKPKQHWSCDLAHIWGINTIRRCQPTHWCEIEPPLVGDDVPIDAAVLAEREACAEIADEAWCKDNGSGRGLTNAGPRIRSRGQK